VRVKIEVAEITNVTPATVVGYCTKYRGAGCATYTNEYAGDRPDGWGKWEAILDAGRRYMVGASTTMAEYLRHHRSPLQFWQKLAYRYCMENPDTKLVITTKDYQWEIYKRGEFVEFGVPHHDMGGEMHYISRNGLSKVKVNQD